MQFLLALVPVCLFLAVLLFFDSFRLIPPPAVLVSLAAGAVAACVASLASGHLTRTRVGEYLHGIEAPFPGEVLAGMLCLLRLPLELALQANGLLLMREAGFEIPPDPDVREKFAEVEFLERNIGPTGVLLLLLFLHTPKHRLRRILRG